MAKQDGKFIKYLVRPTYCKYVQKKYELNLIDSKGILEHFKGPAIILVNHCHILDPAFVSIRLSNLHIRWVTGAHLFKSRFKRYVLKNIADCISKQQGRSDFQTIKNISQALKKAEIIGLFPEGTRTWDGEYEDLNTTATAKLLKIFKVPVLFLNLEGAYNLAPRWADYHRKGSLDIRVVDLLEKEDFDSLKLKDLEDIVKKNLGFSASKWQEENKRPYYCNRGAEGIERLLYKCPICNSNSSIYGDKNLIKCRKCNSSDYLDEYMQLKNSTFKHNSLFSWNNWQKLETKREVKNNKLDFPKDNGLFFRKGLDNKFQMISKDFTMQLKNNSFILDIKGKEKVIFELDKIQTCIINVKQTIEIYYDNILYSIRMDSYCNSLKYYEAWKSKVKE